MPLTHNTQGTSYLSLTPQEVDKYETLVEDILNEHMGHYNEYRALDRHLDNTAIDLTKWKINWHDDNFANFIEKNPPCSPKTGQPIQSIRRPNNVFDVIQAKHYPPTTMSLARVNGTVDDAMYGAHIHDTLSMKIRSTYNDDHVDDCEILATFQEADHEDPYRFCGIVWLSLGNNVPFVTQRDAVYLVAMGMTHTPNGERIGYNIHHSLDIDYVRPAASKHATKRKYIRAHSSFVIFRKQVTPSSFHFYCRGFFAMMGLIPDKAMTRVLRKTIQNIALNSMTAAYAKKLTFLMSKNRSRKGSSLRSQKTLMPEYDCAGGCLVATGNTHHRRPDKGVCMICDKPVCRRCKSEVPITLEATEMKLIQKKMYFCIICLRYAKELNPFRIAVEEVAARNGRPIFLLNTNDTKLSQKSSSHTYMSGAIMSTNGLDSSQIGTI